MAFNVSYIYQAIDKFSGTANKIARSMNNLAEKSKKANLDIKQLGRGIRDAGTKMTAFATTSIGFLGYSMVKAASDAEESASKFNTVFSSIEKDANNVAKNLGKNYGLSRTASKELMGDTGDLLTGFGFTQESALGLSKQVQELAVDLASFTNFSGGAEGASKALTKALLGERESVKSLGISILEEDVKARVKQLVVVDKMRFASMRQAKAFATLQLAQEQSKNAIGDFARTSGGYANQVRIMSNRLQDLKETLGVKLLPIALKIVKKITELSERFENLSPKIQKIILVSAGLVAAIGPLLLLIGGLVIGFGLLLSPIGLVVAGITALTAVAIKFKPIGDTIRIIFHSIKLAAGFVIDKISQLIDYFKELFSYSEGLTRIGEKVSGFFGGMGSFTDNLAKAADSLSKQDNTFGQSVRDSINADIKSRSIIEGNINVNAPPGVVNSVDLSSKGSGANLGMSMAGAQ